MTEISVSDAIRFISREFAGQLGPSLILLCHPLDDLVMPGHEPVPGKPDTAKCLCQQIPSPEGKTCGIWFHIHDSPDSHGLHLRQYAFGMIPSSSTNFHSWKPVLAFVDYASDHVSIASLEVNDLAGYFHPNDSGANLIQSFQDLLVRSEERIASLPAGIHHAQEQVLVLEQISA